MEINGRPRLACMTRMSIFTPDETLTITPMRTFPVIRDLVTDVSFNYEKAREIPSFTPDPSVKLGEFRMQQVDVDRSQEFRKCIECFLCQNTCHVIRDHEENEGAFAGPRFLMRVAELEMHPADTADRREIAQDDFGLGYCNITKCCTEVCPENIKITDNALIPMKERVVGPQVRPAGLAGRQDRYPAARRVRHPGRSRQAGLARVSHLTYPEAVVVGLIQGVTELFPVSSLGHNVLLPAIVGGSWAADLNVAASESPYLAFIVGLHVATAIAIMIYFWRDWVRIVRGFCTSVETFPGADRGREAVLDPDRGHDPGRPGRADLRARVPGAVRQADQGGDLPGRQRPDPVRRRAVPHPAVQAGRRGPGRPAGRACDDAGRGVRRGRQPVPGRGAGPAAGGRARVRPARGPAAGGNPGAGVRRPAVQDRLRGGRDHRVGADPRAAGRASAGTA